MSNWNTPSSNITRNRSNVIIASTMEEGFKEEKEVDNSLKVFPSINSFQPNRPQVAAIHPTPQLEEGSLSPLAPTPGSHRTPRIPLTPLTQLDQSQLSQRLFHSPVPIQSQRSPTHSLSPLPPPTNTSQLSYISPSNLLHTQFLTSPVPRGTRVLGRDRGDIRHQLNTERQLEDLKQQVEQLGTMVYSNQVRGSSGRRGDVYQYQVEELCQEREELMEAVEERERELVTFKNSLATLNSEYLADLQALKSEAQQLSRQVKEREDSRRKVEEKFEEEKENRRSLDLQYKKSLKTIQGLKTYISSLPAVEEVRDLKAKLENRQVEVGEVGAKAQELESQAEAGRERLKASNDKCLLLEVKVKELEEQNKELQGNVTTWERRRYEARGLGEEHVELLVYDKQELEHENEKLRNIMDWKTKKFGDEKHKLEEQVSNHSNLLEQSNSRLQSTATQLRETNTKLKMLEIELKNKIEEKTRLSTQLEKFGAEMSVLMSEKAGGSRLDGHYSRLSRSMAKCIGELVSLNDLVEQVVRGEGDPNISVLLGVREVVLEESPLTMEIGSLNSVEERLELVRQQLAQVGKVQYQVKDLRTKIAEKYSDNLADNMTSCVQQ